MKRKTFHFFGFVIIGLISCNKGDDTSPNNNINSIDPVGVWKLESDVSTQNGNTATINATTYPCLAKNILTINSDGTSVGSYTGNDTCYIINTPTQQEWIGQKGDYRSGTWTKSGNSITFTLSNPTSTSVGQLSMANSKYLLIFTTTVTSINRTSITTFTK